MDQIEIEENYTLTPFLMPSGKYILELTEDELSVIAMVLARLKKEREAKRNKAREGKQMAIRKRFVTPTIGEVRVYVPENTQQQ